MRHIQPPKDDPYLFSSDDSQEEEVMGKDPDPSNCVMHIRIKPVMHIASDEEEVEMNSSESGEEFDSQCLLIQKKT